MSSIGGKRPNANGPTSDSNKRSRRSESNNKPSTKVIEISSSDEGDSPVKKTVHHFFADPKADVTLESTDGVLFKVSSYHLARSSKIFADMFALPLNDSTPIDLPFESKIIEDFLILSTSLEPRVTTFRIDDIVSLAALCRQFEADKFETLLRAVVQGNAWNLLRFADGLRDVKLGREALRLIGEHSMRSLFWDVNFFNQKLRELSTGWELEIRRKMVFNYQNGMFSWHKSFKDFADKFDP